MKPWITAVLFFAIAAFFISSKGIIKPETSYYYWEDKQMIIHYYDSLKYGYGSRNELYKIFYRDTIFKCYKLDNKRKFVDSWELDYFDTAFFYDKAGAWIFNETNKSKKEIYKVTRVLRTRKIF